MLLRLPAVRNVKDDLCCVLSSVDRDVGDMEGQGTTGHCLGNFFLKLIQCRMFPVNGCAGSYIHNLFCIILLFRMVRVHDDEYRLFKQHRFMKGGKSAMHDRNFCPGKMFKEVRNIPV